MTPEVPSSTQDPPQRGSATLSLGWQAPSVEQMQDLLPQYEFIEILGCGGMGAVYKGMQKSLKRLVAIKVLPPDVADEELKFVERFQNEAQTMAAMNHPAILAVYDFGETKGGLFYFVMEYVDGTDVQKMIQAAGRLSGEYAVSITAHVCDALAYAHSRGVIHRDIKPANILIDREGHVKVADFGLAKTNDPSMSSSLTRTNLAMGTPDYVAPEALTTGMVVDHRADLYAVGVMLYQMLTGEVPRGMFKMPSAKGIGTDPRFDEIICKAMEQDREERYQTAGEVRSALDVILTTPQAKNHGTGIVKAADMPQLMVTSLLGRRSAVAQVEEPSNKRSSVFMSLSLGTIVVALGAASYFMLGGTPEQEAAPAESTSGTIDILRLVDLKRDVVAGNWVRSPDGISKLGPGTTENGVPRLQLPYQPPEEYDFEVEFTPLSDKQSVGQMISAQSRMFSWIVAGYTEKEPVAGFEMFDGGSTSKPSEISVRMKSNLVEGQRYVSCIEVRKAGLRGLLDGVELVNWRGNFKRLSVDAINKLRDDKHLGLRAARNVLFHKITVREISGKGKVDAGAAPKNSASIPTETVKSLSMVTED